MLLEENFKIFSNQEFGYIRTLEIDGEPWFVGKDVAEALGYKNTRQALATNVMDEDRGVHQMDTPSGVQKMTFINESGLYALIFKSKLKTAQNFKHWVTSEVLPSLRKTGKYSMQSSSVKELPATYKEALLELVAQIEENEKLTQKNQELETENQLLLTQQEEDKPKIEVYNAISNTQNTITVARMAGILFDKEHIRISQKKLYDYLRDKGYLCTAEHVHNKPSQRMLDKGYMTYKEFSRRVYNHRSRSYKHEIRFTPCITGEGQTFITSQVLKSIDKGELVL